MLADPQFWVLVAFLIFIGIIFNPVRRILSSNLDNKINDIKTNIDHAENLKNDAYKTLNEIKKKQNEVKDEIEIIQKEAKYKISLIEDNANIKLQQQINKRNELAKIKIDQMTRDANIMVQQYISQSAIAATINFLKNNLDIKEKQNLIDQSMNDLKSIFKN